MAIIMGKGCLEAIYGLMGWKGLRNYCGTNFSVTGMYSVATIIISRPHSSLRKETEHDFVMHMSI